MTGRLKILLFILMPVAVVWAKAKHPFDVYNHEMHTPIFEGASVACETCHADPLSYGDRTKVNPMGCHLCHNSPQPILPVPKPCTTCHVEGPPKPASHKTDWVAKHQTAAKREPAECQTCHTEAIFCMKCHQRRDTIQQTMHRRNFRLFHSIEARANPRKCDACHTVSYCQDCHTTGGSSKR